LDSSTLAINDSLFIDSEKSGASPINENLGSSPGSQERSAINPPSEDPSIVTDKLRNTADSVTANPVELPEDVADRLTPISLTIESVKLPESIGAVFREPGVSPINQESRITNSTSSQVDNRVFSTAGDSEYSTLVNQITNQLETTYDFFNKLTSNETVNSINNKLSTNSVNSKSTSIEEGQSTINGSTQTDVLNKLEASTNQMSSLINLVNENLASSINDTSNRNTQSSVRTNVDNRQVTNESNLLGSTSNAISSTLSQINTGSQNISTTRDQIQFSERIQSVPVKQLEKIETSTKTDRSSSTSIETKPEIQVTEVSQPVTQTRYDSSGNIVAPEKSKESANSNQMIIGLNEVSQKLSRLEHILLNNVLEVKLVD